jgi:peptide/nickel transport system ATP-binding protein
MSNIVMQVKDLRAYYITEMFGVSREVKVIEDISISVKKNEVYGVAGESGCGKTTLLRLITNSYRRPLKVLNGTVNYDFGRGVPINILTTTEQEIRDIRWRDISYIMQGSMNVLNPLRKIYKSFVDFAYRHLPYRKGKDFRQAVIKQLEKLCLPKEVLNSYPHELSGGMKQRVAIALATICEPRVIIADEPTTALDVVVQRETLNLIKQIQKTNKNTVILVTHDLAVHANIANRIAIMYAGCIVEEAATKDIFENPRHPYTKHLVNSLPRIGDKRTKSALMGSPPNLADPPSGCRFHPRCTYAQKQCTLEKPISRKVGSEHTISCFFDIS